MGGGWGRKWSRIEADSRLADIFFSNGQFHNGGFANRRFANSYSSTNGRTLEQDQSRLPSFYLINTECPFFLIGKTFFNKQNRLSLYFVYQPPGIDGFCNKAARCIIGPIRHALLEKEASEKMQKENPVECEIIKARNFNSSFYSVVWPALGIRPRTVSWVSGGSQYHGF